VVGRKTERKGKEKKGWERDKGDGEWNLGGKFVSSALGGIDPLPITPPYNGQPVRTFARIIGLKRQRGAMDFFSIFTLKLHND